MRSRRSFVMLALAAGGFTIASRALHAQALVFSKTEITLVARSGSYELTVELADNLQKMTQGLRFRHSIPRDSWMLFLFGMTTPVVASISTAGLMLTTDILFVTKDGRVVGVNPWVLPNSPTPVVSLSPVAAALQLAGGTVLRLGIGFGDRLLHPMFGQTT